MPQTTLQSAGLADLLAQAQAQAHQPVQMQADNHQQQATSTLPGLPGGQPAPVAQAAPAGAIEIELSEPVSVKNGQLVDTIWLRPPTLGDWLDCGDLMQAQAVEGNDGTPKVDVRVDPQAAAKWFTRLSGQPMRYFRSMSLRDWRRIMNQLQTIAGDAGDANPMM